MSSIRQKIEELDDYINDTLGAALDNLDDSYDNEIKIARQMCRDIDNDIDIIERSSTEIGSIIAEIGDSTYSSDLVRDLDTEQTIIRDITY